MAKPTGSGVRDGRWTREMHEDATIKTIRAYGDAALLRPTSPHHHPGAGSCDRRSVEMIIKANRAVAQARTHLTSIGPRESGRTMQLWRQLGKIEEKLKHANKYVAMCAGSS